MKYLKKYNESKLPLINSMSSDDLEEKLKWLNIEYKELSDEIQFIRGILRTRKEDSEELHSKSLPKNVFDLDGDNFDWVFKQDHTTTSKKFNISREYINQLTGVNDVGFNRATSQYYFYIATHSSLNREENGFELKPDNVKTIKFLGDNLKRVDGYVEFSIQSHFMDCHSTKVRYYSENNIEFGYVMYNGEMRNINRVNSIEDLLKSLVDKDLLEKYSDY